MAASGRGIAMETDNGDDSCSITIDEKIDASTNDEEEFPAGTTRLECQVAGHTFDPQKHKIGLLRGTNGRVLKSGEKPVLQEREIAFYNEFQNSDDPIYKELTLLTPKCFGTFESIYRKKRIKFLVLKDITEGMSEPCVMDVKIGRRTWDPLAGPEKRQTDERKYAASKKAYGFCIPGFQVYNIETGELNRYNKDYGKKLDANGVIDALKMFLNATPGSPPCRELVVRLLAYLWKILEFFRHQKKLRFYSSSLLLVYDAKRLRSYMRTNPREPKVWGINTRCKTFSSSDTGLSERPAKNGLAKVAKSLSPLVTNPLSSFGLKTNRKRLFDRLNKLKRSASLSGYDFTAATQPTSPERTPPIVERQTSYSRVLDESFNPLCRTHSYSNNYDRDIMEMKEDYAILLEELTGKSRERLNWVRVNMIDFTHVFPAEDANLDVNYLEGIEQLLKILETFLS